MLTRPWLPVSVSMSISKPLGWPPSASNFLALATSFWKILSVFAPNRPIGTTVFSRCTLPDNRSLAMPS